MGAGMPSPAAARTALWLSSVSITPKAIRGKTGTKHHNPGGGDPWPGDFWDPGIHNYDRPSTETIGKSETSTLNTVDPWLRSSGGQHHCLVS